MGIQTLKPTPLNAGLTRPMLELLWHSIGMERSNYRRSFSWWWDNDNHRNFYCVSLGNAEALAIIEFLVERKLMTAGQEGPGGKMRFYYVTDGGITLAKSEYHSQKPWAQEGGQPCPGE